MCPYSSLLHCDVVGIDNVALAETVDDVCHTSHVQEAGVERAEVSAHL